MSAPPEDLKRASLRGGAMGMAAQSSRIGLHAVSTVVLARLLQPADYGLFGMVAAVTGFVLLFSDLGLPTATVQRRTLSRAQIDTLFWINQAIALGLFAAAAAIAPMLAWFYDEPRLVRLTVVVALGLPLAGLGSQHRALLQRNMRFSTLATIDVLSMACGVAVGIACGVAGTGYWALAAMHLTTTATATIATWIADPWRPGRPRRGTGVRPMLAFGGHLTGFNIVNYLGRNMDNVLIGWAWGAAPLGLYSRAYGLLILPLGVVNAPLGAVALPAMGRLQDQPRRFASYYLNALRLIGWATMPLAALLFVAAEAIIVLLLGARWAEAGPIFRLLAISALVQPLCNTAGWIYMARGRTDRMFRWGLFAAPIQVAAFAIGLPYGPRGVALAYGLALVALTVPCLWYAVRGTEIRLAAIGRAVAAPFVAALASVGAVLAIGRGTLPADSVGGVLLAAASVGAVSLAILILTGEWRIFGELWRTSMRTSDEAER